MASFLVIKSRSFIDAMEKSMTSILQPVLERSKFTEICRTCNLRNADIPIFNDSNHINISKEVFHLTGVFMHKDDKYSHYICENCFKLLKGSIFFRELCLRNNQMCLKNVLNTDVYVNDESCGSSSLDGTCDDPHEEEIPPDYSEEVVTWFCSSCNQEFLDMMSYDTHYIIECNDMLKNNLVGKDQKAVCEVCGEVISSVKELSAHLRSHDYFPYLCESCPYRGKTADLLKIHKRVHLKEKPFKCSKCPLMTTTAGNLKRHMDRKHSNIQFKCPYCDKSTSHKRDMTIHVDEMHLNQAVLPCNVCRKTFKVRHALRKHLRKVHKVKIGQPKGRLPDYLRYQIGEHNNDTTTD